MKLMNLMIVFLGVSINVMAASNDTSVVERKPIELKLAGPDKVQLVYREIPEGLLYVKIYNDKNTVVANDRISKKDPFTKKYDFSQMDAGKYQVALYDTKGNEVESMEIDLNPVATGKLVATRVRMVGENQYKLLVSAAHPSDMEVYIYENGKLLHVDRFENATGIHKIYTIQNNKYKSQIEFKVKTDEGFSKLISVIN